LKKTEDKDSEILSTPIKMKHSLRKQKSEPIMKLIAIPKPSPTQSNTLNLKKKKGKVLGVLGKRKFVYRPDPEKLRKMQ
jgi:hypothetical protein